MKREFRSLFHPGKSVEVWVCDEPCCAGTGFHRDDGPALIYPDGTTEWWRHGKKLSDAEVAAARSELIAKAMGKLSGPAVAPAKAEFAKKSSNRTRSNSRNE